MRAAWHARRSALAAALTAEPFDAAAVAALLEEDRGLAGDLAARGTGLLLAEIEAMSPAERAAYAAALAEGPRRRHR